MNSKKAKRIRALVKHLQNKGALESSEWVTLGSVGNNKSKVKMDEEGNLIQVREATTTAMLDPKCGKAVYRQMKKRIVNGTV